MALTVPVGEAFVALLTAFTACEIGQQINYAFAGIYSTVDHLNWYLLPIKLKRIFPMIIGITQQPIEMECFGSVTCVRPVFKDVNNNQTQIVDINDIIE